MWWPARRAFAALLKRRGPAPRHVALIMDGNRRYADAAGLSGPLAGHESGYAKMVDAIKWLFELGVGAVSVYAFSLDNFRRDAAEVAGLMALAADKFDALVAVSCVVICCVDVCAFFLSAGGGVSMPSFLTQSPNQPSNKNTLAPP